MFSNLIFDRSLQEFFQFANRNFIITQIICSGNIGNHLKDEGNYLASVPDEIDTISFLPKSKIDKVEDPWSQGRVKIKVGRFIKKFFSDFSISNWNITDAEIERFVNSYKSYFLQPAKKDSNIPSIFCLFVSFAKTRLTTKFKTDGWSTIIFQDIVPLLLVLL